MHNQLIDLPGLLQADRSAVADASVEYMSMLNLNVRADHRKVWKFMAAQLTYNSCVGDWASGDKVVLHALFHRLVKFCKAKATKLHIIGLTVTLEESVKSGGHVHAHVYIHMNKAVAALVSSVGWKTRWLPSGRRNVPWWNMPEQKHAHSAAWSKP